MNKPEPFRYRVKYHDEYVFFEALDDSEAIEIASRDYNANAEDIQAWDDGSWEYIS